MFDSDKYLKDCAEFTHVCKERMNQILKQYHLTVTRMELVSIDPEWKIELGGEWYKLRGYVVRDDTKQGLRFIKEFNADIGAVTDIGDVTELVNSVVSDIVAHFFQEDTRNGARVIITTDGIEH